MIHFLSLRVIFNLNSEKLRTNKDIEKIEKDIINIFSAIEVFIPD